MTSPNIFPKKISQILSEAPFLGIVPIPAVIFDLPLSGADLRVTTALFYLEKQFSKKTSGKDSWFFATTRQVAKISRCSPKSAKRSRARLEFMGLIASRIGEWQKRKATQYRILIDDFYRADDLAL